MKNTNCRVVSCRSRQIIAVCEKTLEKIQKKEETQRKAINDNDWNNAINEAIHEVAQEEAHFNKNGKAILDWTVKSKIDVQCFGSIEKFNEALKSYYTSQGEDRALELTILNHVSQRNLEMDTKYIKEFFNTREISQQLTVVVKKNSM